MPPFVSTHALLLSALTGGKRSCSNWAGEKPFPICGIIHGFSEGEKMEIETNEYRENRLAAMAELEKLGAANRAEAVSIALRKHLLT